MWAGAHVPITPCPGLPVATIFDERRLYVLPDVAPHELAAALWRFLRMVHGFTGDDAERAALLLDTAKRRARTIARRARVPQPRGKST